MLPGRGPGFGPGFGADAPGFGAGFGAAGFGASGRAIPCCEEKGLLPGRGPEEDLAAPLAPGLGAADLAAGFAPGLGAGFGAAGLAADFASAGFFGAAGLALAVLAVEAADFPDALVGFSAFSGA